MQRKLALSSGIAGAAFVLLLASSLPAQTSEFTGQRQGFYLSGVGPYGTLARTWSEDGAGATTVGPALSLRGGRMLAPHLGLGLAFDVGAMEGGPASASFGGLALEGQWEIAPNLALRAAVGLATLVLNDARRPDYEPGGLGAGSTLGVSYDWFFSDYEARGSASLTPVLAVRYLAAEQARGVLALVGLEFSYWTGGTAGAKRFSRSIQYPSE